MTSKRSISETSSPNQGASSSTGEPPAKKVYVEPYSIGSVSSQEEMDIKVLRFQNKKLVERLDIRSVLENDLRGQIERLQQRQNTDEYVLGLMNQYWTQLEEDLRILLERFKVPVTETKPAVVSFPPVISFPPIKPDPEPSPEIKTEPVTIKQEIKQEPGIEVKVEPVEVKGQGSDCNMEGSDDSQERIYMDSDSKDSIKEEKKANEEITSFLAMMSSCDQTEIDIRLKERCKFSTEAVSKLLQSFDDLKSRQETFVKEMAVTESEQGLKMVNDQLYEENKRLTDMMASLQERQRETTMKYTGYSDKLVSVETKLAEAHNQMDDLQYDLNQAKQRAFKLELLLEESYTKLKTATFIGGSGDGSGGLASKQLQSIVNDLEENKDLASSRLNDLEKLQEKYQDVVKDLEQSKMNIKLLPEHVIKETATYKCLQSQFSVLYKEAQEMKSQMEDARALLQQTKNTHLRQIEQMESDELACQKKLRTEVMQLEDNLAQVQKEYEMLRIEFEQNLAANEQAGPINRELRHLVSSYQSHNAQLKGEISRYRRKLKEAQVEISKLKTEVEKHGQLGNSTSHHGGTSSSSLGSSSGSGSSSSNSNSKDASSEHREGGHDQSKRDDHTHHHHHHHHVDERKERERKREDSGKDGMKNESDLVKELRASLKKAQESQKELKLLLDMYKGLAKEQREKAQIMSNERKARMEIDELQKRIRHLEERERQESRKMADDDAMRKIRALEEGIHQLQKKLAEKKQEEEALLSEMDVTGQAFEDMQEMNTRLLQQLREKDDANFKLMSERIKSNQIHKLLREEKDVLADQVGTLQTQVDAQNQVVRKLEEKERVLQTTLSTVEKELTLRQQTMDMHKRKAMDIAQQAADLKLKLDKIDGTTEELQRIVKEKSSAVEQENHKFRRAQEECVSLKRKVERYKRMELASSADEVLAEEVRSLKEQLTCPCCKKGRKDVVLTKCFHVFCFNCIKTRYETRQRKCPKCNAGFGANDYHRIWLD
ncbi:E3 ubiquitin-protein ligase BRE1A-like [Lytechinus variegatus]|uniref:E3 ubiquitin-protein ligase BRE1A-like n=1 Tax=Lytechinus variegatus TaxID=7654 RepID=UPI001BB1C20D|nr:E3 ubiquitin-protein ligase BRE1A-like [Lytechinus variegatus]